jgi:hypothetical protein
MRVLDELPGHRFPEHNPPFPEGSNQRRHFSRSVLAPTLQGKRQALDIETSGFEGAVILA